LLFLSLGFFIAWFFIHEAVIIVDGLPDEYAKSDYTVVFGNTVNADGSLSERLKYK